MSRRHEISRAHSVPNNEAGRPGNEAKVEVLLQVASAPAPQVSRKAVEKVSSRGHSVGSKAGATVSVNFGAAIGELSKKESVFPPYIDLPSPTVFPAYDFRSCPPISSPPSSFADGRGSDQGGDSQV